MFQWLREFRQWQRDKSGLMGLSYRHDDVKAISEVMHTRGYEVIKLALSDAAMQDLWTHGAKAVRAPGLAAAVSELRGLEARVKAEQEREMALKAKADKMKTDKPDDRIY